MAHVMILVQLSPGTLIAKIQEIILKNIWGQENQVF